MKDERLNELKRMKRLVCGVISKYEKIKKPYIELNKIGEKLYDEGVLMIDDGDVKLSAFHAEEDLEIELDCLNDIRVAIEESMENLKGEE